jgi:hypothetical protein
MAQKTPLTTLTINYAERWTGTWFSELQSFRTKLIEDLHLRFLILSFLRVKDYWLYLLNINYSGGYLFLNIMSINSQSFFKVKAVLPPTQQGSKLLNFWEKNLMKSNFLLKNNLINDKPKDFTQLRGKRSMVWQRLTEIFMSNGAVLQLPQTSTMNNITVRSSTGYKKNQKLLQVVEGTLVKKTLTVLSPQVVSLMSFVASNSLCALYRDQYLYYLQKNLKLSLRMFKDFFYSQKAINYWSSTKKKNVLLLKSKNKIQHWKNLLPYVVWLPRLFQGVEGSVTLNNSLVYTKKQVQSFSLPKKSIVPKRFFSTINKKINVDAYNFPSHPKTYVDNLSTSYFSKNSKQTFLVSNDSLKKKVILNKKVNFFQKLKVRFLAKALLQNVTQTKSYLLLRIFAFKRYVSLKQGFDIFFLRFRNRFNFIRGLKKLQTPLIFVLQAIKRLTGLRTFYAYLPINWYQTSYLSVKNFVFFEKFGRKKYFLPTFVAAHYAMSKGSAILLMDLLVRVLRHTYSHTQFLDCVEKICRYCMAPTNSNIAYKDVFCKGIEILFTGKVNGSDRSKQWRFKLGPVHSSTFYTNTREENAKVITKFGAFGLRIRLKLGLNSSIKNVL